AWAEKRVDDQARRKIELGLYVERDHHDAGFAQGGKVILLDDRRVDDDRGGLQSTDFSERLVEVLWCACGILGGQPVVAAALDGRHQCRGFQSGQEERGPAPALQGRCERRAAIDRLVAGGGGGVDAE